jgi:predicted transcriptional regulator
VSEASFTIRCPRKSKKKKRKNYYKAMREKPKEVILSIKRKYLDMILEGEKNVEFRKKVPEGYRRYYLCCEKQIWGWFEAERQLVNVDEILSRHWVKPGIDNPELLEYAGKNNVYVLEIGDIFRQPFHPRPISDFGIVNSPQNYCYVKPRL